MTFDWGHEGEVVPLVMELCGFDRGFGECRTLAIFDAKGAIVGGLVFHNWCPESGVIEVSVGSSDARWLTRSLLRAATGYAYDTCGCHAIVARTSKNNPSRRIWNALGADENVIQHLRGPNQPEYIYLLPFWVWENSRFARL